LIIELKDFSAPPRLMNSSVLVVVIISVLIGVLCGGFIVFLIFAARKTILANSLDRTHTLVGSLGVVQIPFDYTSKGKVRVYSNDSMQEFVALTDHPHSFEHGDRVLIVQVKNTYVWVVPGDF